jgi:hypothetical protein
MGAYSSFAMLALTHHFIVQYAAMLTGRKGWYDNYALLGDDIVLGDKDVASNYLYIMRDILGVGINLSKSLESNHGVLEFAKRLIGPEGNMTPIGAKVILQTVRNLNQLPMLIRNCIDIGIEISEDSLLLLTINNQLTLKGR